jgi:hypothetical protein
MKNKTNAAGTHEISDEKISRFVQAFQCEIPPSVEDKLEHAIMNWDKVKKPSRQWFFTWYPAAAALTAAIIIAALFIIRPFTGSSAGPAPITEIRTEFELKDKNIKIIWFQKKDFELRRKKS